MAAAARPLTLGEILDRTVQIYRRHFPLFAGISVLPSAVYVAISGSMSLYYTENLPALQQSPHPAGAASGAALLAIGVAVLLFLLLGLPLLLGTSTLALSALNYAAIAAERGEPATIRLAYSQTLPRFWRYLGIESLQLLFAAVIPGVAGFLVVLVGSIATALGSRAAGPALAILIGLLVFLFALAVVAACVWVWLRFCLAFPASAVENKRPWPALQRSAELSKGARGRIFVMYLLVFILTLVTSYALMLPVDIILKLTAFKSMQMLAMLTRPPLVLQIVNLVISCLERAFTLPIYAIALVLFYNDQRTRMEGYDIEQLMDRAGWSQLQPVPGYAPAPIPAESAQAESAPPASGAAERDNDASGFASPSIESAHPAPALPAPALPASEGSGA